MPDVNDVQDAPEAEEQKPLTPQERHDAFVAEEVQRGSDPERAEAVYKIITEEAGPIDVINVEALGIPFGASQIRVGREWDTTLEEQGNEGFTDVMLATPLGLVSFSVNKAALVEALTKDVSYVSPQKAPVDA